MVISRILRDFGQEFVRDVVSHDFSMKIYSNSTKIQNVNIKGRDKVRNEKNTKQKPVKIFIFLDNLLEWTTTLTPVYEGGWKYNQFFSRNCAMVPFYLGPANCIAPWTFMCLQITKSVVKSWKSTQWQFQKYDGNLQFGSP